MSMMTTVKQDFPVLKNKELVYLDTGATAQRPQVMIDTVDRFYCEENASVHRGIYTLSENATNAYERARDCVRDFIHATESAEIIFTRGTTESINLVAASLAQIHIQAGDEIMISAMEHHANIVPWQVCCEKYGAILKVVPIHEDGSLDEQAFAEILSARTKLVALTHVSNVLGTINPVKKLTTMAHAQGALVLIDGAQGVPHMSVDVQDIDCDFYAFSAHKMYGPTGVGVLYGKREWLEKMPPYQTGGAMIAQVTFEKTTYADLPQRFEAGTPNIAGVIGLEATIRYLNNIGMAKISAHEKILTDYATQALLSIKGLRIIGTTENKASVISFVMAQAHPHDIGTILNSEGIAIRAGHHCAMPLMDIYQVPATARVSLGIYNTQQDIDRLLQGLDKVLAIFG